MAAALPDEILLAVARHVVDVDYASYGHMVSTCRSWRAPLEVHAEAIFQALVHRKFPELCKVRCALKPTPTWRAVLRGHLKVNPPHNLFEGYVVSVRVLNSAVSPVIDHTWSGPLDATGLRCKMWSSPPDWVGMIRDAWVDEMWEPADEPPEATSNMLLSIRLTRTQGSQVQTLALYEAPLILDAVLLVGRGELEFRRSTLPQRPRDQRRLVDGRFSSMGLQFVHANMLATLPLVPAALPNLQMTATAALFDGTITMRVEAGKDLDRNSHIACAADHPDRIYSVFVDDLGSFPKAWSAYLEGLAPWA